MKKAAAKTKAAKAAAAAAPKAQKATAKPAATAEPAKKGPQQGIFVRANLRPKNVMAKPVRGENPFGRKDRSMIRNVETARQWLAAKGISSDVFKQGISNGGQSVARVFTANLKSGLTVQKLQINQVAKHWKNPQQSARAMRGQGYTSTSSPTGALWHEIGHLKDPKLKRRYSDSYANWHGGRGSKGTPVSTLAKRVSKYAATDPHEFVAETYAGRRTGRRYDHQVMRAYRKAMELPKISVRRTLRRKPR